MPAQRAIGLPVPEVTYQREYLGAATFALPYQGEFHGIQSMPKMAANLAGGIGESFADLVATVEKRIRKPIERCPTGWPSLDAKLGGGLPNPSIVVIGAPPKVGKTTLAQTLMERHLDRGDWGLYLDLENGLELFARNTLMRQGQITEDELEHPNEDQESRIERSLVWMKGVGQRLKYLSDRSITAGDLDGWFSALRTASGPKKPILVIFDSLQKLPRQTEARAAIDQWLRWCETARDEHRLILVLISELHRPKGGKEGYGSSGGTGYKESGDIEYTADLALDLVPEKGDRLSVRVPWNRHGKAHHDAVCTFWLDGERHTLVEK